VIDTANGGQTYPPTTCAPSVCWPGETAKGRDTVRGAETATRNVSVPTDSPSTENCTGRTLLQAGATSTKVTVAERSALVEVWQAAQHIAVRAMTQFMAQSL
jgi:hypothetical protein